MGILNDITGYGPLLGGIQQQSPNLFSNILGISQFPLGSAAQQAQAEREYRIHLINNSNIPSRRHVESEDVTPRERARKAINGAVKAVKNAQKVG